MKFIYEDVVVGQVEVHERFDRPPFNIKSTKLVDRVRFGYHRIQSVRLPNSRSLGIIIQIGTTYHAITPNNTRLGSVEMTGRKNQLAVQLYDYSVLAGRTYGN